MYRFIITVLCIIPLEVFAQECEPLLAYHSKKSNVHSADTVKKLFSNSESPLLYFDIKTNMTDKSVKVQTNFTCEFKVRLIDYFGKSVKVFKNINSNKEIDISEYVGGIYVMNILDSRSNKLLTSQVVNFKRRKFNR